MRPYVLLFALIGFGCRDGAPIPPADFFAEPSARPELRGAGGPLSVFDQDDLYSNCGFITAGEQDQGYHHAAMPYRGHLVMPWAPAWGDGGLSLFDIDVSCEPELVGSQTHPGIRETRSIGFVHLPDDDPHAGDWAVTSYLEGDTSGVQFWDLSDATAPTAASKVTFETATYPDAHTRVSQGLAWQYPWLFVAAGDEGIFVIDATDPLLPQPVSQVRLEGHVRAARVSILGNQLLVSSTQGADTVLLDVSEPSQPEIVAGGVFTTTDADGTRRAHGSGTLVGDWGLFSRTEDGGGPMIFDLSDPAQPTFLGDLVFPDSGGGSIFFDEDTLFVAGGTEAHVLDVRDIADPSRKGSGTFEGRLETVTPYGNLALLSVDGGGTDGFGTAIMPWFQQPDTVGPKVLRIDPPDGATGVAPTARIGVGFNEFVEPSSVFAGSIRVFDADDFPVDGWGSAHEASAAYTPKQPLVPGTTYRIEVLAEGITDLNGNVVTETYTSTFTTAN